MANSRQLTSASPYALCLIVSYSVVARPAECFLAPAGELRSCSRPGFHLPSKNLFSPGPRLAERRADRSDNSWKTGFGGIGILPICKLMA
jgi:hypothetical protein